MLLEVELGCFFRERVAEDRPDDNDNGEVDEVLLGGGEERCENIGCDKKFKTEHNFIGKVPPDLVVSIRSL